MQTRRVTSFLITVAVAFVSQIASAAGWTHAVISKGGTRPQLNTDFYTAAGADRKQDYDSFTVVRIPSAALSKFMQAAAGQALQVEPRDDFSILTFASAQTVDTRTPTTPVLGDSTERRGTRATYAIQLVGPPTPEWLGEITASGANIVRPLQQNGYLMVATPSDFERLSKLPFIQFTADFRPSLKLNEARTATPTKVIIELADIDTDLISRIAEMSSTPIDREAGPDVLIRSSLTSAQAKSLLRDPMVLGIHHVPRYQFSDERVALGLTVTGGAPFGPGYTSWLANACPSCGNLNAEGFRVGMLDSGLDNGLSDAPSQIVDLQGREYFGTSYSTVNDCTGGPGPLCDTLTHGTLVAGILAGNGARGDTDQYGYLLGMGVAPTAGVFCSKFPSNPANILGNIYNWANDARSVGVYIQNHSHNDYSADGETDVSGQYTLSSRQFDFAVRDSDGNWSNGITPITLTVSAGNIDQSTTTYALAPATAKNVISVGSSESVRSEMNPLACRGTHADDFRNLSANSKRGTLDTNYFKPDIVAPSTMMVSTRSPRVSGIWCQNPFNDGTSHSAYIMDSGTSFAAPAAAASVLLAARRRSADPALMSPAYRKAELIAGARSMIAGVDQRTGQPLAGRPNAVIGFGLLNLSTLFSSLTRAGFDGVKTFTSSGQTWSTTLYCGDPNTPVTIVLVWSDAPGLAGTYAPLSNNLDLTVNQNTANGCLYGFVGNNLDTDPSTNPNEYSRAFSCSNSATRDSSNNVEVIRFLPGYVTSSITVTVRATGMSAQGVPNGSAISQDFALFVLNAHS